MPIQIAPVLIGKAHASGLTVQWKGGAVCDDSD